jgi:hypothetical protein
MATHLKDFEIRSEDCHILYAKLWNALGRRSLEHTNDSNLALDRIIYGNCYQKRSKVLLRKASRKDKGNATTDASQESRVRKMDEEFQEMKTRVNKIENWWYSNHGLTERSICLARLGR